MQYTLTLTEQEVNLIQTALSELPVKIAMPLVIKIKEQGDKQFKESQTNHE